jgi:hypothetical protein
MSKLSPFDYIKSINEKTGNMMDMSPDAERDYVPFVVNRGLSFSPDTILYANEMNCMPLTEKRMQYDYLYNSIRKRKRFDKWIKREEESGALLEAVMLTYKVGHKRAIEYIRLLSKERLDALLKSKGGSNAK